MPATAKRSEETIKKENEILDDILKRTSDAIERAEKLSVAPKELSLYLHNNSKEITNVIELYDEFFRWMSEGFFDEISYRDRMILVRTKLHQIVVNLKKSLLSYRREIRPARKERSIFEQIEKDELNLSIFEKDNEETRDDILVEVKNIREAESLINSAIDEIHLMVSSLRKIFEHTSKEDKLLASNSEKMNRFNLAEFKKESGWKAIRKELIYLRDTIFSIDGDLMNKFSRIEAILQTLQSHAQALKNGATRVYI